MVCAPGGVPRLGLLVGLGATTPYLLRHAREQAVLRQLGLEDRAAQVQRVTEGDFNRDGWRLDHRVDYTDGSVEYFLRRGYAASRARPDNLPRNTPLLCLAASVEFFPERHVYE